MNLASEVRSTAISEWTVTAGHEDDLAKGKTPTCDGFSAANRRYFVGLTGFGADSPFGELEQSLRN